MGKDRHDAATHPLCAPASSATYAEHGFGHQLRRVRAGVVKPGGVSIPRASVCRPILGTGTFKNVDQFGGVALFD